MIEEGGQVKFYPYKYLVRGGAEKVLAMLKIGEWGIPKFVGSFRSFSCTERRRKIFPSFKRGHTKSFTLF